jgi:hypothetical protein
MSVHVAQREEWLWSSRPDLTAMEMYLFVEPLQACVASPVADYWATSFGGHGINSYSMNFFVVRGPLALFLQEAWDGVYMDREEQRGLITEEFQLCAQLLAEVDADAPRLSSKGRLVVAASGFRPSACGWLGAPTGSKSSAAAWLAAHATPDMDEAVPTGAAETTLRLALDLVRYERRGHTTLGQR